MSDDPERIRRAIENDMCPFCDAGPFKSVASHTVRQHEVTAADLRERAGLPRTATLTSEDYHERISEDRSDRAKDNPEAHRKFVEAGHQPEVVASRASAWERPVARDRLLADRRRPERIEAFREAIADVDWSRVARNRSEDAVRRQTERVQRARERWAERVGEDAVSEHMSRISAHVSDDQRHAALEKAHLVNEELRSDPEWHEAWRQSVAESAKKRRVLTGDDVVEIKRMLHAGESTDVVADVFGCSRALINMVRRGEKDHFITDGETAS